jgi:hypothetical protein
MSLQQIAVTPPVPLVARKSALPMYIVVDPAKVPSVMPVMVNGNDLGGRLQDTQLFVARDLRRAFANYFEQVSVVTPAQVPASGPGVVVDVRLDRLATVSRAHEVNANYQTVSETEGRATLNWSVAMRKAGAADYLWTFTGASQGDHTSDPNVGVRSLFEHAITDMITDYTQQHVQDKLQAGNR